MGMSRRGLFGVLGGAILVAAVPLDIAAAMPAPILDEAIRTIGPEGMEALTRNYLESSGNEAHWVARFSRYAETVSRLARERDVLSSEGFLRQAGFDAMESAISDPLITMWTRRMAEAFVTSVPGYRTELPRQSTTTMDQFGYRHMVLECMIRDLRDGGDAVVPQILAGSVDWRSLRHESLTRPIREAPLHRRKPTFRSGSQPVRILSLGRFP